MSVRLQNTGKRVIRFGRDKDAVLAPNEVGIFQKDVADYHLKLFPNELRDIDNVKVSVDQTKMKDFAEEEKPARGKPGPKPKGAAVEADTKSEGDKTPTDDELAAALKNENK